MSYPAEELQIITAKEGLFPSVTENLLQIRLNIWIWHRRMAPSPLLGP
ncbi:hypothetical protein CLOSTHATH_01482 [Hungatella hathewayi DSM 13479]|uniref:Uncharacterized protein n=1 Tax=Hungatella hathewayi DSM 13479 TaxID=566550 RepID=D3AD04_9FIRM|nr:hypothetical protein CLOSTHATH_01482 [Hungatella hathewayi DSM 13479]